MLEMHQADCDLCDWAWGLAWGGCSGSGKPHTQQHSARATPTRPASSRCRRATVPGWAGLGRLEFPRILNL